jgi:hypothetical protein
MSYRFIVRTAGGLSSPATDDFVYLRRFKYQTLKNYMNRPSLENPTTFLGYSFAKISLSVSFALLAFILFVTA